MKSDAFLSIQIHNGTQGAYIDPDAPVHIVTGSAVRSFDKYDDDHRTSTILQGCGEHHDPFGVPRPWTAFQSDDYGYTRMNVFNATHLYLEQVSDDQVNSCIRISIQIESRSSITRAGKSSIKCG